MPPTTKPVADAGLPPAPAPSHDALAAHGRSAATPQRPADARCHRHMQALEHRLPGGLVAGNRVQVLVDGPDTYDAMFSAIDEARDHINIESYIVEAEGPGQMLARRLIAKRRQGVKVNLLFDHFGSLQTASGYFEGLRRAGVQMCCYNPLNDGWKARLDKAIHHRDHRKLLVVDGRVAFTGGINISSVYSHRPATARTRWLSQHMPWRDTHVRIEGPVVAHLQQLFIDHWQQQTGRRPYLAHYFPPLAPAGSHCVGVAACSGGGRRNPFYAALLEAIDLAQERVCLTAAYFVPPPRLVRSLCRAARRGVRVELVLPSVSDAWAPLQAGRSHYGRLLRAGVQVHERCAALLHAKTAVIDGVWASVGSSNLDWRSVLHNAEANVVVLDPGFGAELEAVFEADVARSHEVTLQAWRERGWMRRAMEALSRQFEFFL